MNEAVKDCDLVLPCHKWTGEENVHCMGTKKQCYHTQYIASMVMSRSTL